MDLEALLITAVWTMTPIAFAAVGEAVSERSGVLNIGLEGMMLAGAFVSIQVTVSTGSAELGLIAGAGAGVAVAALNAVLILYAHLDQVVTGLTIGLSAADGDLRSLIQGASVTTSECGAGLLAPADDR